jgi:heme/copper-type cytochrome/quinol oxidase subunit 1
VNEPTPPPPESRRPNVRLSFAWFGVGALLLMVDGASVFRPHSLAGPDTYYVVGHAHWSLTLGAVFCLFGALYLGMTPKFPIRLRPALGWTHLEVMSVGALMTQAPILGLRWTDPNSTLADPIRTFETWNRMAVTGYVLTLVGLGVFVVAVIDGLRRRPSGSR